ncbi:SRPBCC family protein [Chryseolinea lacunae]|uniref:SRPBCC domain-containing protein n=1 Tax=Chryseolinea lacunae TaxID=2801331 RepID=A0ABS1L0K2_9BACT|nr:SRPBCC domain-containing protein [Chryseolinea lacunae]MBL0745224.1 SRPBCC domain-containing protein [Chryseolinea lacunae]
MKQQDYAETITVNATPHEAFTAINNVTQWWTDNLEGNSQKLNDEFTVRFFDDIHVSTQKLIELVPDKKVVWLVTHSTLNFIADQDEWTGTKITFEISQHNNKTQIHFTHLGLIPQIECFKDCSKAWAEYLQQSLANLINTGKGNPTLKEQKTQTVN